MSITSRRCDALNNHVPTLKGQTTFLKFNLSQLEFIGTHIRVRTVTLSCIEVF
jgi:hypothetical protein